ncbi:MAG: sigma-70 family RNA polymerase sigma factor [Bacteroidota bacterium]
MQKDGNEILEGIKAGNQATLNQIYKEHLPIIRQFITTNSGTSADGDDIFQQSLLIIYRKLKMGGLEIDCAFGTYLYSICKRLWLAQLRKNKRSITFETLEVSTDIEQNVQHTIERDEQLNLYKKHFSKLQQKCQQLLTLFYRGESMKVIAEKMGYTESYTRKKKFECKKGLIELVEKDPIFKELK